MLGAMCRPLGRGRRLAWPSEQMFVFLRPTVDQLCQPRDNPPLTPWLISKFIGIASRRSSAARPAAGIVVGKFFAGSRDPHEIADRLSNRPFGLSCTSSRGWCKPRKFQERISVRYPPAQQDRATVHWSEPLCCSPCGHGDVLPQRPPELTTLQSAPCRTSQQGLLAL